MFIAPPSLTSIREDAARWTYPPCELFGYGVLDGEGGAPLTLVAGTFPPVHRSHFSWRARFDGSGERGASWVTMVITARWAARHTPLSASSTWLFACSLVA